MKKSKTLVMVMLLTSLLAACSSASTDHNGKTCPAGTKDKTACNRTLQGH